MSGLTTVMELVQIAYAQHASDFRVREQRGDAVNVVNRQILRASPEDKFAGVQRNLVSQLSARVHDIPHER